jgi:glycosyltransferase involved in cell wall biosynthesis
VYDAIFPMGGGSQIAMFSWFKNLKKQGIEVKLFCNLNKKVFQEGLAKDDLINDVSINLSFLVPEFPIVPFLSPKSKEKIIKYNPQIIHFHEPSLISYQLINLAKKNQIKTLFSFHTNFCQAEANQPPISFFFKKNGLFNRIISGYQFLLLKKADYFTVPSFFYQRRLSKIIKKKPFILPYPIAQDFFKKHRFQKIKKISKLITVSRLSKEKNIDLLIETMSYLKNRFSLTIVGEGIDSKYLKNKTKKLGLEKVVKFTGWVDNRALPKIISKHQLFVSASDYETFGISYIEALALKLPCLVYDYPVSREVIPNNMAIFLKSFRPKTWAKKLIEIQEHPLIYHKLLSNINMNFQKIYQYHEEQSTLKLIEIYKKILHRN